MMTEHKHVMGSIDRALEPPKSAFDAVDPASAKNAISALETRLKNKLYESDGKTTSAIINLRGQIEEKKEQVNNRGK